MGDSQPVRIGQGLAYQRLSGWGDQGWVFRAVGGGEHLLWRQRGVATSAAASLPRGALAIGWTRGGASQLDIIYPDSRRVSQPLTLSGIAEICASDSQLLVGVDRSESALVKAAPKGSSPTVLALIRGRVAGPVFLADGRLRFPVTSAGVARLWERDRAASVHPWGRFTAASLVGPAPSPNSRYTAAVATADSGGEVVVFDQDGTLAFRWKPHARSINPAGWMQDGRRLIVPVLDGAGWRLFALDPLGQTPPKDLNLSGFAVVESRRDALYGVRAGETTGMRELWRLDGTPRRLPIDLSLLDIVNWRTVDEGIWLPDRRDPDLPRLVLREERYGRIVRALPAPDLAGPSSGLAAREDGAVYVKAMPSMTDYTLLRLRDR